MILLPIVDQFKDFSGRRVFVRGDIDVPLSDGKIVDDSRLRDIWPTIEFLMSQSCEIVLAGHLGRPEGKVVEELSSKPVASWISKLVNGEVLEEKFDFIEGFRINEQLAVLENLRFNPGEEANSPEFAKNLAGLAEIYVNESFAVSEREHASVVLVPKLLPHFAGFRLAKEIEVLSRVLENSARPLVVIIGGAKLETKIPLISKMEQISDVVIVGGKLVSEIKIGSSIVAMEKVKILRLTDSTKDITLDSIDKFKDVLTNAGTVVWNGPMGLVEEYPYQVGTRRVAELVAAGSGFKVVGGGDTVGFLKKLGLLEKFDWVCSGGGSMLKFLAGENLPGVEALMI